MKGSKVDRVFGWDCHGLPAEMESEKELGITGRKQIQEFGVEKFNNHCQESVMKYTKEGILLSLAALTTTCAS